MRKFFATEGPEAYLDFSKQTEPFCLRSARDMTKSKRVWRKILINSSRNISVMTYHKAVIMEFRDFSIGDKAPHFMPTPEFSQFWADRLHSDPKDVWDEWVAKHPVPSDK